MGLSPAWPALGYAPAEEWIRLIDRGELWQVNDDVFQPLHYYGRRNLKRVSARELKESTITEILDGLLKMKTYSKLQWITIHHLYYLN